MLPRYFNSEWSVAQFRLLEGIHYTVAFGHQKNTVVILGMDGRSVTKLIALSVFKYVGIVVYAFK